MPSLRFPVTTLPSSIVLLVALPVGAQVAAARLEPAAIPAPVVMDTTGLFQAKIARVGDDLFIAGQPTERALRELRDQGVTVVVNLRPQSELDRDVKYDEKALIGKLGMQYVHLPVRGSAELPYAPATVDRFAEVLKTAKGKVLLHCTVAWRASHLWAAYLIRERGMSEEKALASARAINLMDDHRMGPGGRQPVEHFLERNLPTLGRRQ
jgi:uncharacterized protein (TIGR01244 family)